MDALQYLEDGVRFIDRFYETATAPFVFAEESDGSEFFEGWMEADRSLIFLGHSCVARLALQLKQFLDDLICDEGLVSGWNAFEKKNKKKIQGEANRRLAFLAIELKFNRDQGPVSWSNIEQIILARNDGEHGNPNYSLRQSDDHYRKHAKTRLASSIDLRTFGDPPESPTELKVTRNSFRRAVDDVINFCRFIDSRRRTKPAVTSGIQVVP